MNAQPSQPDGAAALRQRAEAALRDEAARVASQSLAALTLEDTRRLLHELQVHQIELEMQNEELRRVQLELDAARARYFDLYDQAPVGYCTLSESGLIEEANLTIASLLGVARGQLTTKPFSRFIGQQDADKFYLLCNQLRQSGAAQSGELQLQQPDGTQRWVELTLTRMTAGSGAPLLRLVLSDICERKRAEAKRIIAMAEAERANNAKSRFLAAASHDLRQPLSALALYAGMLKNMVAPGQAKLVTNIENCVDSLSELLTDLLDVSKLDAGVVTPTLSRFAVDDLLARLISIYTVEAELKGLRLRWRPTSGSVHADHELLARIVSNFIANAIRYTDTGGVLIACRRHQGKRWIEVWDTGIGIAADNAEVVFEEFRQLNNQAHIGGSGLGLAIAAKTAKLLGLQIRLRSRPGRGTMFAIELPAAIDALPEPAKASTPAAGGTLRIAVVEDNEQVRDALSTVLQHVGHEVIAADSSSALLERLGAQAPDIVISDYRLGTDETGFDVIGRLRQVFHSQLPAILITGDTDPALVRSMANRGVAIQYKPLQMEALQSLISEIAGNRET